MIINVTNAPVPQVEADAIVVGLYEGNLLDGPAGAVDRGCGGLLSRLRESGEIAGRAGESTTVLMPQGLRSPRLVLVGLGDRAAFDRGAACRAAGSAARLLAAKPRARVAFFLGDLTPELTEAAITGVLVGCEGQDLYRSEKKLTPFSEVLWSGGGDSLRHGQIIGESVNLARRLVNEPASALYPETFAATAQSVAGQCGLEIEIWDRARLESERCGSLLGVARGSVRPPRLVILGYRAAGNQPTLGFVGKGVTFDSGGLSLKPTDNMKTMKCDMAGAATVLAAMQAIAQLKLPVNVIGLMGLVENMVSGDSFKLGDVLTARNGKTIEVLNTDAEGRLVLADVLDVTVERGAAKIIDLATLTGACVVALGNDVAGLMTNDQSWCDSVATASRTCGEQVWQLPMFSEYAEQIRSTVADIKNVGDGRWAGAITAAKFLEEFVAGKPWVHMDIAGPAFLEKPKAWLDAGGSGAYVRTLVEVARGWCGSTS